MITFTLSLSLIINEFNLNTKDKVKVEYLILV